MSNSRTDPVAQLHAAVAAAAAAVGGGDVPGGLVVERPKQSTHGDYATNAAMTLAPVLQCAPREAAERVATELSQSLGDQLSATEVAGPGFLNLRLADRWFGGALGAVLNAQGRFGAGVIEAPEKILVEFVSANPTGPMHIGHGRNAAYGDALCRVLAYAGHQVSREFYINDFGSQVNRFGESLLARAKGEPVPEDGYHGEYIDELAASVDGAAGLAVNELALKGVELMCAAAANTLSRMRVEIDSWFSERSLHDDGRLDAAMRQLDDAGVIYETDGATWLRTSNFGDDKDRVLRRSNGELTYFATDIAYHADKRARGFERLIDVWGADHHGYVARMKAAYQALGGDPDLLEPVIMQLVNLVDQGKQVKMSKRGGDFIMVDDLLDDIGVDALRFFLLQRSHDTAQEIDLALAREQSQDNPVFYVQYAHARIASILRRVDAAAVDFAVEQITALAGDGAQAAGTGSDLPELHGSERELVMRLLAFPDEIAEMALRRGPHRLTIYSRELAAAFSAFYRDCKVVGAESPAAEQFRLALCVATRDQLATTLDLLGVSAPQEM